MSRFLLQIAKIVGTPSQRTGSWVHTFSPQDAEKNACRGQLLAVVGIDNPPEQVEVAAVGKEIISRLQEEYYGELSEAPFVQLKKTVAVVFAEATKELTVELAAVGLVKNVLNVSLTNGGKLVVLRQGKMVTILTAEKSAGLLSPVVTASGYVQDADLFLLGTEEFFQLVSQGVLQAALASGSPQEVAETLMPMIHGQPGGKMAAAVIFKAQAVAALEATAPRRHLDTDGITTKIKDKISEATAALVEKARQAERPQKTVMTVALVLFSILVISLVLGIRQKKQLRSGQNLPLLLIQAQEKLKEAKSLSSLNSAKAREIFLEAQALSQQLESSGLSSEQFLAFKKELDQASKSISKEWQVAGKLFFDLGLLKANARGDELVFSADQLIILDKNQTTVYSVGVKDKKSVILAGGEDLAGAKQIAATEEGVYVLTEKGILEKKFKVQGAKLKVEKDSEWGEIADMNVFGGSLYLLDKRDEIWKYAAAETGFGQKQKWLNAKADFSQAMMMEVDGSIWVLKSNGEVLKLAQGGKANFRIAALPKPITSVAALYTDAKLEHLYLLDKDSGRIIVLEKSGEYGGEYLWEGIKEASGLVVSEAEKKIWLLTGSKIYEIEI